MPHEGAQAMKPSAGKVGRQGGKGPSEQAPGALGMCGQVSLTSQGHQCLGRAEASGNSQHPGHTSS